MLRASTASRLQALLAAVFIVTMVVAATEKPNALAQTGYNGPPGWEIWVMSFNEDMVYVLDSSDLSVKHAISVPGGPGSVAFGVDNSGRVRAFVSLENTSQVGIVDADTGALEKIIDPGRLWGTNVVSSPDGSRIYVLSCEEGTRVLDISADDESVNTLPISNAWSMDFSDDGSLGYIMHCWDWIAGWADELIEIDVASGAVLRPISFASLPFVNQPVDFVTVPGTRLALFAELVGSTLATLDLSTGQFVAAGAGGDLADGAAWDRVVKDNRGDIFLRAGVGTQTDWSHVGRGTVDGAGVPSLPYASLDLSAAGPLTSRVGWGYDLAAWEGHAVSPSQDDVIGSGFIEVFEVPNGAPAPPVATLYIGNGVFELEVRRVPLAEQVGDVITEVNDLVAGGLIDPKFGDQALDMLEDAQERLAEGKERQAVNELEKLVKKTQQSIDKGATDPAAGASLIDAAQGIMDQINSGG